MKTKNVARVCSVLLAGFIFVNTGLMSYAYDHDPMMNPKTAEDIVVNPDAVYGYSPNPDSKRLGSYANMAWDDAETVEAGRQSRLEYFSNVQQLIDLADSLNAQGKSTETIARAVSAKRNEIRIASYKGNEEGLAALYESNLKTYGTKEGPTAEGLYNKYGSWTTVLQKAFSVNSGMDACLGLYDKNYSLYKIVGEVPVYIFNVGNTKVENINTATGVEITECIANNVEYAIKYDKSDVIDLGTWTCMNSMAAELLKVKDTSTTFVWTYNNNRYTVTLPAGCDITQYMENGYVGMMKLYEVYNGIEVKYGDKLYAEKPCYM